MCHCVGQAGEFLRTEFADECGDLADLALVADQRGYRTIRGNGPRIS